MYIGGYNGSRDGWDNCFEGKIDEVRISNIARGDAWIKTTFNSEAYPDQFLSFGIIQQRPSYLD